jgi:tetratricopeptide (TPR) repeat protein
MPHVIQSQVVTALAAATLLALPHAGQQTRRQRDLAFARELASRYQYVDLAETVLGRTATGGLSDADKASMALVQCQVYAEGARRESDPTKRLDLFGKASKSYRDFFSDFPFSDLGAEAERSYMALVNTYGLALEQALEDAVGEEATALRERTREALEDGLKRSDRVKEAYDRDGLTPAEKQDRWSIMMDRAQMLITLGNVSEDPYFQFNQAGKELEKVVEEAGETSAHGLNAFRLLTKLYRAQGDNAGAVDFAEYVVHFAIPEDAATNSQWADLPYEVRLQRFRLVELVMVDLIECIVARGDMEHAASTALYFLNNQRREGFELSPYGHLATLAAGRALLEAGGYVGGSQLQGEMQWFETAEEMNAGGFSGRNSRTALELALSLAQEVNDANKKNILNVRAQKLISDIIDRPGIDVSPEVLFQAAEGEYYSENYAKALESLRGVRRALASQDEATQRQFAPRILFRMGESLRKMDRTLESAMAYREGSVNWGGDLEYDEKLARAWYGQMRNLRQSAAGDPTLEAMYLASEQRVIETQNTGGADDIQWSQAQRVYDSGDFEGARRAYLAVGEGGDQYERALIKASLCLYKLKRLDEAAAEFRRYLEVFVPDPQHAITGARKQAARAEARAQATYYLGKMAFDSGDHEEVLKWLESYAKDFPGQDSYGPRALYMVTNTLIGQGAIERAKAVQAELAEAFPDDASTGRAGLELFQALRSKQEAAEQAGDTATAMALKQEMAEYMRISNETASSPAFNNLRLESTLWLELENWTEAERVLRRTMTAFEKTEKENVERFVLPDLGHALLGQERVPEAFAILEPLVPKDDSDTRKPSSSLVTDYARAVTGWLKGAPGQETEVPGVGGETAFGLATDFLGKLISSESASNEDGHGSWSCPWYALKFDLIYAYLKWSGTDSSQGATAKRLLDDLSSQMGDPDFGPVATECGNDELRQRYLWLRRQL